MKHGVFIFATDLAIDPISLARAAEERGFESLWVPEHVHMPVDRETRFPGTSGWVAAGRVPADSRSVRGAGRGGGGDDGAEAGDGHLSGDGA